MNLCKDCKHYKVFEYYPLSSKALPQKGHSCYNEKLMKIDPVVGKEYKIESACYKIRDDENLCGKDGKWFEDI